MKLDTSVIPKGYYCHDENDINKICPYWELREDKEYQANGYCKYLGKGDWDLNEEIEYVVDYVKDPGNEEGVKVGDTIKGDFSLLWDMCKMCKINE